MQCKTKQLGKPHATYRILNLVQKLSSRIMMSIPSEYIIVIEWICSDEYFLHVKQMCTLPKFIKQRHNYEIVINELQTRNIIIYYRNITRIF